MNNGFCRTPVIIILHPRYFIAPKASAEGACIFSKLVTMERVMGYYGTCMMGYDGVCIMGYYTASIWVIRVANLYAVVTFFDSCRLL